MKVEVSKKQEFNPVTISITIESKLELDLLNEIVSLNCTIPDAIGGKHRDTIKSILGSIFYETAKLIK